MALEIKAKKEEKGIIIDFKKEDHIVVEIKGELYPLHKVHAEKLIKAKKAKEVKNVEMSEPKRNKTVEEIDEKQ